MSTLQRISMFLVSIVIAATTAPVALSAQQTANVCHPETLDASIDTCPGYSTCTLEVDALFITKKPNCAGCCFFGTITVTCDTAEISSDFSRCTGCGSSTPPINVPCPATPSVQFGVVYVSCSQCAN